jgi:hypothetical protein
MAVANGPRYRNFFTEHKARIGGPYLRSLEQSGLIKHISSGRIGTMGICESYRLTRKGRQAYDAALTGFERFLPTE